MCYLNENLNVVLLSVREDYEKYFAPAVHSIGPLINRPENLYNTVSDIELLESFKVRREGVINSCYGERGENYLLNIIKKLRIFVSFSAVIEYFEIPVFWRPWV